MKKIIFLLLLNTCITSVLYGQSGKPSDQQQKDITSLIDQYSEAREKRDTVLLKNILTPDIDQLVSNGEWRTGIRSAVDGMMRSSASTPGTRTLRVETIKMLNADCAIADCRYEIQNTDGTLRKMWSSFVVIAEKKKWKISAIRNMLPSTQ
jgi:ketosteroid isomerase-like protein